MSNPDLKQLKREHDVLDKKHGDALRLLLKEARATARFIEQSVHKQEVVDAALLRLDGAVVTLNSALDTALRRLDQLERRVEALEKIHETELNPEEPT